MGQPAIIARRLLGLETALHMAVVGPTPRYEVHTDINPTRIVPAGPDLG